LKNISETLREQVWKSDLGLLLLFLIVVLIEVAFSYMETKDDEKKAIDLKNR
jgi:hypothetical protein